jgi:hypothetical protein
MSITRQARIKVDGMEYLPQLRSATGELARAIGSLSDAMAEQPSEGPAPLPELDPVTAGIECRGTDAEG